MFEILFVFNLNFSVYIIIYNIHFFFKVEICIF